MPAKKKATRRGRKTKEEQMQDVSVADLRGMAALLLSLSKAVQTAADRTEQSGADRIRVPVSDRFKDAVGWVADGVREFEEVTKTPLEKAHGLKFLLPETGETQIAAESKEDYDEAVSIKSQSKRTGRATPRKKSDTGG